MSRNAEDEGKVWDAQEWLPASVPPTERGRYAVIYRYGNLPPAYFTADWDDSDGEPRWMSLLPPNRVLYWMPYAPMPEGVCA